MWQHDLGVRHTLLVTITDAMKGSSDHIFGKVFCISGVDWGSVVRQF
jgi:hypothetical protein